MNVYLTLLIVFLLILALGLSFLLLRDNKDTNQLIPNKVYTGEVALKAVQNPPVNSPELSQQTTVPADIKPKVSKSENEPGESIAQHKKLLVQSDEMVVKPVEVSEATDVTAITLSKTHTEQTQVIESEGEKTPVAKKSVLVASPQPDNSRRDKERKPTVALRNEVKRKDIAQVTQANEGRQKALIRKSPTVSPQMRDQNMADSARKLFADGESRKAYRSLYDFIGKHQMDEQSRLVLISYLLQDERIAEAGDVLVTTQVSQNPELRQLKARWYVARGESKLALHTLRENLPELQSYPEYYALLAAYYQQYGFSVKAAETYANLLKYDSESANWWAGFAIALDSSLQYERAMSAYNQALETPGLSQDLREYIKNRLSLITAAASR